MPVVRGCSLPDELLYDVDNHTWYREVDDNAVEMGMTQVATALAGQLVAFTPKKVGRAVQAGKSCATIESGKWVGPAKVAGDGEMLAVNQAMIDDPKIANADPYKAGWLVRVKMNDWPAVKTGLTPGASVAAKYEAKMAADGFGLRALMLERLAIEPDELESHADRAAEMLRSMANKWRLLVLCNLVAGEKSVGELQRIVGISQSALSQHLATLRAKKLVAIRRDAQTIYYRLNGPEVAAILTTLYSLYCGPDALVCGIDAGGI